MEDSILKDIHDDAVKTASMVGAPGCVIRTRALNVVRLVGHYREAQYLAQEIKEAGLDNNLPPLWAELLARLGA